MNNKNLLKILAVSFTFSICGYIASAENIASDTTSIKAKEQTVGWSLTSSFHSASLYFFTGSVDQSHPSFDALFIYDKKTWGGFIYKSLDIVDHTTGENYAMLGLHKIFQAGTKFSITPTIGLSLNQNYSLADKGSDLIFNLATAYKPCDHFTLSNDAFFQNIGITKAYNWTNRLKLTFRQTDFFVSALLWERSRAFHNPGYLSTGLDIGYDIAEIAHNSHLFVGVSNIYMLQSDTPRRNGFMFNLGVDFGQ